MTVGGGAGATFTTSGQTMNSVGFSISAVISGEEGISTDVPYNVIHDEPV